MMKEEIDKKNPEEKTADEKTMKEKTMDQAATALSDYREGAKLFRKFIRRPKKYKDQKAMLRVEMTGLFSGWKLKDELVSAFGIKSGDCLFMNDLYVLGFDNLDVQKETWMIDGMADGAAGDWIENAEITRGTVFEGVFTMKYMPVSGIKTKNSLQDTMIAMLILEKGHKVIEKKNDETDAAGSQRVRNILSEYLIDEMKRLNNSVNNG